MSYPNQRKIYIRKPLAPKAPFVGLNKNIMAAVYQDLKGVAFYLYLCLLSNKENYGFDYSPAYLEKWFGLDEASARRAIKKLDEKGYIVPINENSRLYDFNYQPAHIQKIIEERKLSGIYFEQW